MTLQQTVNVTKDRLVHLPVPDGVPVGMTEITITFTPYRNTLSAKKKNTLSLLGMFSDTGDTIDKFLTRKQTEKQLEYENG